MQFPYMFARNRWFLAKTPLKSSPKRTAVAFLLHFQLVICIFCISKGPSKNAAAMLLKCSCHAIFLHICKKKMVFSKNTLKSSPKTAAIAFLLHFQLVICIFLYFQRAFKKCSCNAPKMQLPCNFPTYLQEKDGFQQKHFKIQSQNGCNCIFVAFLAGDLHFFVFPKGLQKMQLQCS